jgi:HK97 family phage prohead protease
MMVREYLPADIKWKAASDDANLVEGYASVFGVTDLQGDVVKRGAFKKTIRERVPSGQVKFLDSHIPDASHVVGTVVEAKEDERGLFIRARLSSAPSAQDLRVKMLEGHLDRMSIGYSTVKDSWQDSDGDKVRVLEEVKLYEVSVVPFPANEEAAISAVKEALRVAGSGIVEAPVEERKTLASELSDALADAFEEPVTLVVGRDADEVKAALETKDSPPIQVEDEETPPSPDEPVDVRPPLKEIMRRATAVLEGRDPNEVAEPTQIASLTARLELEERLLREHIPQQDDEEEAS